MPFNLPVSLFEIGSPEYILILISFFLISHHMKCEWGGGSFVLSPYPLSILPSFNKNFLKKKKKKNFLNVSPASDARLGMMAFL